MSSLCNKKNSCLIPTYNKNSNISSKTLQSKMILQRRGMSYQNSNTNHILYEIHLKNSESNKKLLLTLGKNLYERYFDKVLQSYKKESDKNDLVHMYELILDSLTINEEKKLGIYVMSTQEILQLELEKNNSLLESPDFIFYCKMVIIGHSDHGPKNLVILNKKKNHILVPGKKYVFDLSHESNNGHQLSLSAKQYDYTDVKDIYFIGVPGNPNSYVVYKPNENISLFRVFFYDKLSNYSGAYNIFGRIYNNILIEINYKISKNRNKGDITTSIECLSNVSEIRMIYNDGPKYLLEQPSFRYQGNVFKNRYVLNKKYGLCKGTYILINNSHFNPFTIINKNKTNNIRLLGNRYKKTTLYVKGLSDDVNDTTMDGSYNFFHGNLFIDVSGDFGTCGLYSFKYGYNCMENLLIYDESCERTDIIPRLQDNEIDYVIENVVTNATSMDVTEVSTEVIETLITDTIEDVTTEEVATTYDYSYNTPFTFSDILQQNISVTLNQQTSFTTLDRIHIYYNSSYLAIDNSFEITSVTSIDNYSDLLSSTFHIVEDTSYNGYYRLDSELHSMYSLDISNGSLYFNNAWDYNRTSSSGYTIFSLDQTSITPYRRYSFDTSTYNFVETTLDTTSSISVSFYYSDISLSIPYDFNPTNISYVTNDRVSWENSSISSLENNIHYNGTTYSKISSTYLNQLVESGGNDITSEYYALQMLNTISSTCTLRYDINVYLSFRNALLNTYLYSNTIVNGELYMNTAPYVYFTNELSGTDYHPFMVIATYSIADKPNRLIDVPRPPGDGTASYPLSSVTRDATLSNYLIKIPLKDYGVITSLTDNDLTQDSGYNNLRDDASSTDSYSVYNYSSISSIGIAIDGVPIYPVLNNTLTPAQEQAEITNTGIHVGQGLQLHYHADGHSANPNGLNLYNSEDYSGNVHPPLIGFGYDGIALYGTYDDSYASMYGYDTSLDEYGGHTHEDDEETIISFGYHYHAHQENSYDEGLSTNSYTLHILMKGAWKGNISSIPNFWDGTQPKVKGTDKYTGS